MNLTATQKRKLCVFNRIIKPVLQAIENTVVKEKIDISDAIEFWREPQTYMEDVWDNSIDYIGEIEREVRNNCADEAGINPRILPCEAGYPSINLILTGKVYARLQTPEYVLQCWEISNYDDSFKLLGINPKAIRPTEPRQVRKPKVNVEPIADDAANAYNGRLTILLTFDAIDWLNLDCDKDIIVVPKGAKIGFFDSYSGGGGLFECELLQSVNVDLSKGVFNLVPDCKGYGYSTREVYGEYLDDCEAGYIKAKTQN